MAVVAVEISQILAPDDPFVPLLTGTISGALAMLGPGRWSLDARLFGWKRIESPPRKQQFRPARLDRPSRAPRQPPAIEFNRRCHARKGGLQGP